MSDCGCEKAIEELGEYLHHELCAEDEATVREHLANCPSCREELRVNSALIESVQRACRERAPETLRLQVLAALAASPDRHAPTTPAP
ncbi:hypothetical protein GCM10011490_06520 [Pseudoclavibacter endophyticus]|uniref:Alpha-ketoglutarate decarboxylase n=1 Tax=Pseudoclavibacter endophyticus TaxID=1778590 RepID=A0A6H9WP24_9MICO|nr:zf-HC2 domain-containing protein [Pseudoclavibacter endophyticus]KAB1649858.1 alpha-ketoglutarate decarboxylase [Pseudoclavibacter endophyticus]GGA59234.1 hypothetical protein GCM10011490_06520 [Pseudoclavibacter endophyticus]